MEDKIKNSEAYLNSVLGKENGFSVPKNYFNEIDERLSMVFMEEKIPNKKSFATPESYFDNLEDAILSKVTLAKKDTKVISFKQKIYKAIPFAIAASIALLISINYFSNFNSEINFDNLAQSDIETWILENNSEMTSQDIATFISLDGINTNDFAYTNIDDEDIEDYIIYNDNTTLLNEIN